MMRGHTDVKEFIFLPVARSKKESGFSLVEVLVSIVLSLFISASAIQLFVSVKSTFSDVERLSENVALLTYVTNFMVEDFRRANGFVAILEDGEDPEDLVDLGGLELDDLILRYDPGVVVEGICISSSVARREYFVQDGGFKVSTYCENANEGDPPAATELISEDISDLVFSRASAVSGEWNVRLNYDDGRFYSFSVAVRERILTNG